MNNSESWTLIVHEDNLKEFVLPLLSGRIFHVTSKERFDRICESSLVKTNVSGCLGTTFPQSSGSIGRRINGVCLFDLREKSTEAIEWGLSCLYFLGPAQLGEDIVFMLMSPEYYTDLKFWNEIPGNTRLDAVSIPEIECWHVEDVPIYKFESILHVHIKRRGGARSSLESIVGDSQ